MGFVTVRRGNPTTSFIQRHRGSPTIPSRSFFFLRIEQNKFTYTRVQVKRRSTITISRRFRGYTPIYIIARRKRGLQTNPRSENEHVLCPVHSLRRTGSPDYIMDLVARLQPHGTKPEPWPIQLAEISVLDPERILIIVVQRVKLTL